MDNLEKLYRLEEICRYLRVSRNTVRSFIYKDSLKTITLSKQNIRVAKSDLEAFIDGKKSSTYQKEIRQRIIDEE